MNREVSDDLLGRLSHHMAPNWKAYGGIAVCPRHRGKFYSEDWIPGIGNGSSKFEKGCATREGLLFLETEKDAKI